MNKKGMTLVEIVVAISLISVVMIFLFQVLITVINGNKRNNSKSKTIISKTLITKAVEHDLDAFGLNNSSDSVINCSNNIDQSTINQILPATVEKEDEYYCIKLIYNENNIKNNEGYILFYKNNNKGFLAYKRGKKNDTGFILETQVVRELDAYPKEPSGSIYKLAQEGETFTLKIDIPIIAEDGNNYDLTINYISSDSSGSSEETEISCTTFANDEWDTIGKCVNKCINNIECDTSVYSDLDKTDADKQKTITIDGNNYTVRIANDSNYDCTLESKTACGFVVEFVDIVEKRGMNSTAINKGGWPATAMRAYLNGEFLEKLPSDLQSVIAETYSVSGHGTTYGETNFTSRDRIYLLSTSEVWTNGAGYDFARYLTRQLDYYTYSNAIKQYNGIDDYWWLRSAYGWNDGDFYSVRSYDYFDAYNPTNNFGVSPAFRIGNYE